MPILLPAIDVYVGDDWVLPFAYQENGEGVDLTGFAIGACLYRRDELNPLVLEGGAGSAVFINQAEGAAVVKIDRDITAAIKPDASILTADAAKPGPTRVHVFLLSASDERVTIGDQPLRVLST